ncbi:class I SAM-dependent methyltransferase [Acidisoma cellulosilytica]|uniref:Class I SAM-dependent methyltransferase n=1 Tax=Acidisoma cellulosilyticum TaxID=2802395 RepID=A0A964E330_9PROT|nr:cyclopropane-fatty-acyl-phospholipid synthase family protein [Acidisoma cellulosilyticum]MCB8880036.1 class I SAM-dependent methyltransferase [Acidisoma cellulosilyticum]
MSSFVASASIPFAPGALAGRFVLAKLLRRLALGRLVVRLPGGVELIGQGREPGPEAVLVLHNWRPLLKLALRGDVGFAESYMDGDWQSPDLPVLIELAARNQTALGNSLDGSWLTRVVNRLRHGRHANTKMGARRNIMAHYDLGNDFYRRWLDDGMTYSSALYRPSRLTLEQAQTAKQDRILQLLDIDGGEEVLEIGCGWGGLAERLVQRGCRVTGLTLSPAQLAYASDRLAFSVQAGQADLRLQDYRDVEGQFDRVVSIEMLEAVGRDYWPLYFQRLQDCLAPGGTAVLQVISISEEKFEAYLRVPDFIQLYVFPGGMLPTISIMQAEIARVGLTLDSVETFGLSYAETLAEWRRRFHTATPRLRAEGMDEAFSRRWDYYLAYCEAGFRASAIDVGLYRITKPVCQDA